MRPSPRRTLPALQDVGLVRFHDPLEYLRIAPRRRQKPVTPAERRAHRHIAACRRGLHRLPLRQATPQRQPAFRRRTGQRVEGPAAALAAGPRRRETLAPAPGVHTKLGSRPSIAPRAAARASARSPPTKHAWKPLTSIIQPPDVPGILPQMAYQFTELSHLLRPGQDQQADQHQIVPDGGAPARIRPSGECGHPRIGNSAAW